jgi:hypothetical protein
MYHAASKNSKSKTSDATELDSLRKNLKKKEDSETDVQESDESETEKQVEDALKIEKKKK